MLYSNAIKCMKRKTLTLSSEFYEKLIHLEPETKHGVLDVVFDFFFAGKSFCTLIGIAFKFPFVSSIFCLYYICFTAPWQGTLVL